MSQCYFTLTGQITAQNTHDLIHFFNSQRIEHQYADTFTIFLSSTGGDIDSAIRVYDFLKAIPNKIHTVGISQIDSAAITIFLAGDKRTALEKTRFRFHQPTYHMNYSDANLSFFEEKVRLFKELDKRLLAITVEETGVSFSAITKLYSQGDILTTQAAKKLGIVHDMVRELPGLSNRA